MKIDFASMVDTDPRPERVCGEVYHDKNLGYCCLFSVETGLTHEPTIPATYLMWDDGSTLPIDGSEDTFDTLTFIGYLKD
jgi:hypothetical protein